MKIKNEYDFGEEGHSAPSEPYFYDAAYQLKLPRPEVIIINAAGQCMLSENIEIPLRNASNEKQRWKCHRECKSLSTHDINVILAFRLVFDEPFRKVRRYLHVCDDDCASVQFNTTNIIYIH